MDTINQLRQQYQCPIWETAAGHLIPVTMMTPRHLRNAYRYVQRQQAERPPFPTFLTGELAQYLAEKAYDEALDRQAHWHFWQEQLARELLRRGLPLPDCISPDSWADEHPRVPDPPVTPAEKTAVAHWVF